MTVFNPSFAPCSSINTKNLPPKFDDLRTFGYNENKDAESKKPLNCLLLIFILVDTLQNLLSKENLYRQDQD